MREIMASEAEAQLPELLDDVERGESVIIIRHGRAIARLVPESDRLRDDIERTIAAIKARRDHAPRITVQEILSARNEGRRS